MKKKKKDNRADIYTLTFARYVQFGVPRPRAVILVAFCVEIQILYITSKVYSTQALEYAQRRKSESLSPRLAHGKIFRQNPPPSAVDEESQNKKKARGKFSNFRVYNTLSLSNVRSVRVYIRAGKSADISLGLNRKFSVFLHSRLGSAEWLCRLKFLTRALPLLFNAHRRGLSAARSALAHSLS